jgi:phosphate transport system substrate-binding protein
MIGRIGHGVLLLLALAVACGDGSEPRLSGTILVEGSSTVFPLTGRVAAEFKALHPEVEVATGISGTGGGFQKFCGGQAVIQDASRPISDREILACAANGIDYIELPVAYDALSIVVNAENDWVTCITTAELEKMWETAAHQTVTSWHQVNSDWPEATLTLFGRTSQSGTFDYFTERINGSVGDSRLDYTRIADDNSLLQAVAGDRNALSYVGFAYYLEHRYGRGEHKVQALEINDGQGCTLPAPITVEEGNYPLSRPLFIYVRADALGRREVRAFIDFYLESAGQLADYVGYVRLPDRVYGHVKARWSSRKLGTIYDDAPDGATLEQLLLTK